MTSTEQVEQPTKVVVVQRWKRYGHDRAYIRIDGAQVGFRDLLSGSVHCSDEHRATIVNATEHLVVAKPPAPVDYRPRHAQPDEPATPPPTTDLQPDRDLADNPAGMSARSQANALRAAAPVRTFVGRLTGAKNDERNWRIGADAEVAVGRQLATLGPDWRVLHAVPIGDRGSDIDHVVIGPAGVFTINTKNHPGAEVSVRGETFRVDGFSQPYVRNSRLELRRAATLLSARAGFDVEVRALIVVLGAQGGFTVNEQPADATVTVLTRKTLDLYLRSLPDQLGAPSVERIYEVARHLATWQPKTVGWSDF